MLFALQVATTACKSASLGSHSAKEAGQPDDALKRDLVAATEQIGKSCQPQPKAVRKSNGVLSVSDVISTDTVSVLTKSYQCSEGRITEFYYIFPQTDSLAVHNTVVALCGYPEYSTRSNWEWSCRGKWVSTSETNDQTVSMFSHPTVVTLAIREPTE